MSLLSYVVNWDELALSLGTDITVDVGDLGGVIDSNLPDVTDLLEQIRDILYQNGAKYKNYDQKIEGFHLKTDSNTNVIDWTNEENCYLTGVTCSHSHVEAVDDFFMLSLIKLDEETGEEVIELIFEKVYLKDALQHKYFNEYFPVPAGVTVRITHNNPSNLNKHVWYDLEYLEFFGLREDEEWEDIPEYIPPEPSEPIPPIDPEEPPTKPEKPGDLPDMDYDGPPVHFSGLFTGRTEMPDWYTDTKERWERIQLDYLEESTYRGKEEGDVQHSNLLSVGYYHVAIDFIRESHKRTLDSIVIPEGLRLIYYENHNFKGEVILDVIGNCIVYNRWFSNFANHCMKTDFITVEDQEKFPQTTRILSRTSFYNMHDWVGEDKGSFIITTDLTTPDIKPPETEPDAPTDPPLPSNDLLYLCDNSVDSSSIDTNYFNWNPLTLNVMLNQEGYDLSGDFWEDRNSLLEFINGLFNDPYNKVDKNIISITDFHKFLFKALQDSRSGDLVIEQNWQQFKAWCDEHLSCLTDLQKGSLYYTIKSQVMTNLFTTAEGFIEGKVPDVICKYLNRLPYRIVDWIDYNDVSQEEPGSLGVTGAYAVDIFVSEHPTLLDAFESYVNMEPQTLDFSIQSLLGSNPSDYINAEGDFWGVQVPSSIVDWTNYRTDEFVNGDSEIHQGLVAAETGVHELGHCVDYHYSKELGRYLTHSNEWYNIGGWTSNPSMDSGFNYLIKDKPSSETGGMPKTNTGHEAPVSDYGCSQPMEDFAESFNAYVVNPNFLKDKYPKRFAYMEKYVKPLL